MFNNLPREEEMNFFKHGINKQKFYQSLPHEFKRADAIEIGKSHNLSERTVDSILKSLLGKFLSQPSYGSCSKTQ